MFFGLAIAFPWSLPPDHTVLLIIKMSRITTEITPELLVSVSYGIAVRSSIFSRIAGIIASFAVMLSTYTLEKKNVSLTRKCVCMWEYGEELPGIAKDLADNYSLLCLLSMKACMRSAH